MHMIYILKPNGGVEAVAGSPMHPAVQALIKAQTQAGNHVVDADGHYLAEPIVTHPLWQDPLLAAKPGTTWWSRWLRREA